MRENNLINQALAKLIMNDVDDFLISSEDVASVYEEHSLITALMILTNRKYSTIPVLNNKDQLVGLINLRVIVNEALKNQNFDLLVLNDIQVKDIELVKPIMINRNSSFEYILSQLVTDNFLCLVDDNQTFLGIVTRRNLLSRLNHLLHSKELTLTEQQIEKVKKTASLLAD